MPLLLLGETHDNLYALPRFLLRTPGESSTFVGGAVKTCNPPNKNLYNIL